jgi:hypothetical protein
MRQIALHKNGEWVVTSSPVPGQTLFPGPAARDRGPGSDMKVDLTGLLPGGVTRTEESGFSGFNLPMVPNRKLGLVAFQNRNT